MVMEQQANAAPLVLPDGSIEFRIRGRDGQTRPHTFDLLLLQMICEECVEEHNLQTIAGRYKSTSAFLLDLTRRLRDAGIEDCTPSIAARLWRAAYEGFDSLKKSTEETPSSPSGTESIPEDSPQPSESGGMPTSIG